MIWDNCLSCLIFKTDEGLKQIDYSNILEHDFTELPQFSETLEVLILTSANISCLPAQVFQCQNLRHLSIDNNYMENLPDTIGAFRLLQHLNLNRNLLTTIPDNVKNCKHLTYLDLSCNNLQRLPEAITGLIPLQELFLNETNLEFLPASFGRLRNLKILELRSNFLISLPKSITRLKNLERLDIGGNEFTELPDFFGELQQLRELWIDFNEIHFITPNIGKLHQLKHFEANGNVLTKLPVEINQWHNIELISISINKLSQLQITDFMMKSLVTLKCEFCELNDIPKSISTLENLVELNISNNKICELPKSIGFLRKLQYIFADYNELNVLPAEICSCINLNILSLSHNKLRELPENIGHLKNLKVLNVVNNQISSFPVSVLNLVDLKSLWISDNQSKPLVQFQYLNVNSKSKLTCYMLPQNKTKTINESLTNISTTTNDKMAPSNTCSYQQKIYARSHSKISTNNIKKISFAEKDNNEINQPQITIDNQQYDLSSKQQTKTYHMRSPTPYPKDHILPLKCQQPTYHPYEQHFINKNIQMNTNEDNTIQENYVENEVLILPHPNFEFEQENLQSLSQSQSQRRSNQFFTDNGYKNDHLTEATDFYDQQQQQNLKPKHENISILLNGNENIYPTGNNNSLVGYDNFDNNSEIISIANTYNLVFETKKANLITAKENTNKMKTPWIFGFHKNPKVMQFVLEFERNVGFDVMEVPEKIGIYVSSLVPNTCASKLLNLFDKVLEVDGHDFSMINIKNAKEIISNANRIMNIMISRKC